MRNVFLRIRLQPQNLGIHQAGPRYCWYSPCRSDLRIYDFLLLFFCRPRFRASKMRPRTVTQPFVTVRGRTFWGRQADPVLKSGFFHGLEIQRFVFHRIPGRARSLPPPPPPPSPPPAFLPASVSLILKKGNVPDLLSPVLH